MVTEGIVLGHKISNRGIEVDQAKVEVIEKLPPPFTGCGSAWLVSWNLFRISARWSRHELSESPNTEKSSMKTSKNFSTISEKIKSMQL